MSNEWHIGAPCDECPFHEDSPDGYLPDKCRFIEMSKRMNPECLDEPECEEMKQARAELIEQYKPKTFTMKGLEELIGSEKYSAAVSAAESGDSDTLWKIFSESFDFRESMKKFGKSYSEFFAEVRYRKDREKLLEAVRCYMKREQEEI